MRIQKHTQMIQPSWLHSQNNGMVAQRFIGSLGAEVYGDSECDFKKNMGILYARDNGRN
ncbi:MAG: hypothetical protein HRT68_07270 [Flavobacteriaceae bacterium]|nr:hypothetical protein [Flavobacteriaceae bacterium]